MNTVNDEGNAPKRKKQDTGSNRVERKRELDRLAQRATRERTKNKIADLEQRLASLESGDKNYEIAQLTKVIGDLRQENGRYQTALLKMRFAINEALGSTDTIRRDSTSSTTYTPLVNDDRSGSVTDIESTSDPAIALTHGSTLTQTRRLQPLFESQGYRAAVPQEFGNIDINQIYEFFEYGSGNPFSNPSPLTGRLPPEGGFLVIAPDEHKWTTSDDAFHRGLQANPIVMDFDESVLARAILLGWESIGTAIQHPIMFALQCVDQRVFGKWTSRPQRLALMYICGCAMRWRANPSDENRSKVPPWFLPRPAQLRIEHPLVIDFLVWPGLRERLVFEYEKYQVSGEFSFCFVEYFHFNWPYPDEQVAQYDPESGLICGLSRLYHDFMFDLKNWTMLPGFFESFPEMRADIDMWVEPPVVGFQKVPWT
ncbi:hypothetical protein LTR05_005185 [Lithohypha guttulata]|uniref:BZIP transcription factor n=1 Tax=Lithohypha guttulata TaxID=1690604 RepID=A0AAN7T032_9EURO|nr:hypothetical protein LTR05_005185 [Lithohypha guttulata]